VGDQSGKLILDDPSVDVLAGIGVGVHILLDGVGLDYVPRQFLDLILILNGERFCYEDAFDLILVDTPFPLDFCGDETLLSDKCVTLLAVW
jgi:hypothetical protein